LVDIQESIAELQYYRAKVFKIWPISQFIFKKGLQRDEILI